MFDVLITMQSPGSNQVTRPWARNVTALDAIGAVAQCMAMHTDPSNAVPDSVRPRFVSVTVVPHS